MTKPLRVLIYGATGLIGRGVLRACLEDEGVVFVQTVGRAPVGWQHPKLREVTHADLGDYTGHEAMLEGFDACFFCLGVLSLGMSEAEYTRVTYGFTLAAAEVLARCNPGMTFIYVSGTGTDSTERGGVMWARVKGKTENALLRLPLEACMFRPSSVLPVHGERSRTPLYRVCYVLTRPFWTLFKRRMPSVFTTTVTVGRAMLAVARQGAPGKIVESPDIPALGL